MPDNDSAFPWFRWYNEAANDKKIESICENLEIDYATVVGAWTLLLSAAACSPIRGSLYVTLQKRYSNAAVTKAMRCSNDLVTKLLQEFIDYGMIEIDENGGYRITNFLKRQPPSDNSSPRVQKSREKKKYTVTKPLQSRYSNALDKDIDLNKDIDTDKEKIKTVNNLFVGEFLRLSEIPGINSDYQGKKLCELRDQYSENKVLEFAEWCKGKIFTIEDAFKSAKTALPGWKSKTIPVAPPKILGTDVHGEVIYG